MKPESYTMLFLFLPFLYCSTIKATLSLEEIWSLFSGTKWKTNKYNILYQYFYEQYKPNDDA